MIDTILGIYIFCCLVFVIGGTLILAAGRVNRFFAKLDKATGTPPSVEQTVNQMFGDVRIHDAEGSAYRKSQHAIGPHKTGG